jgi:hypothetical protein
MSNVYTELAAARKRIVELEAQNAVLRAGLEKMTVAAENIFASDDSHQFIKCETCGDQEEIWNMDGMPELGMAIKDARETLSQHIAHAVDGGAM